MADSFTKLLLHCNGVDSSTTFTDSSPSVHTVIAHGNAQIDTAQSKFGGSAGLFDRKSTMKLLNGVTGADQARRDRDIGTFGTRTVFTLAVYCDLVGLQANGDFGSFTASDASTALVIEFASDGLFIKDGTFNEVGTNLVVQDTWQIWTFDVNWTAKTVDIYLNSSLQASGVSFDNPPQGADGAIILFSNSDTTANILNYVDYFKAGSDFVPTTKISNADIVDEDMVDISDWTDSDSGTGASTQVTFDEDYLSLADSTDWAFGSGLFTVDFWVNFNNLPTTFPNDIQEFFNQSNAIFDGTNDTRFFLFKSGSEFFLEFGSIVGGTTIISISSSAISVLANTWYHLSVIRGWNGNANDWAITFNGNVVGTLTDTDSIPDFDGVFEIGRRGNSSRYVDGWIDEFRISKGIARWTANFIPPIRPYDYKQPKIIISN